MVKVKVIIKIKWCSFLSYMVPNAKSRDCRWPQSAVRQHFNFKRLLMLLFFNRLNY